MLARNDIWNTSETHERKITTLKKCRKERHTQEPHIIRASVYFQASFHTQEKHSILCIFSHNFFSFYKVKIELWHIPIHFCTEKKCERERKRDWMRERERKQQQTNCEASSKSFTSKYSECGVENKELHWDNLTETNAKVFTFSGLRIDDVRCSRSQQKQSNEKKNNERHRAPEKTRNRRHWWYLVERFYSVEHCVDGFADENIY